jgi:hypothetical protein
VGALLQVPRRARTVKLHCQLRTVPLTVWSLCSFFCLARCKCKSRLSTVPEIQSIKPTVRFKFSTTGHHNMP